MITAFARALTRGVIQGIAAETQPDAAGYPPLPLPTLGHASQQVAHVAPRVTTPDIAPPTDSELLAAIKHAARQEDVDLSDVALVEQVLNEQRLARLLPEPPEGTRRVTAPDA